MFSCGPCQHNVYVWVKTKRSFISTEGHGCLQWQQMLDTTDGGSCELKIAFWASLAQRSKASVAFEAKPQVRIEYGEQRLLDDSGTRYFTWPFFGGRTPWGLEATWESGDSEAVLPISLAEITEVVLKVVSGMRGINVGNKINEKLGNLYSLIKEVDWSGISVWSGCLPVEVFGARPTGKLEQM